MKASTIARGWAVVCAVIMARIVCASTDTLGRNGINSVGLTRFDGVPLTGSGVAIGQEELFRPGDPDFDTNGMLFHSAVDPTEVFFRDPGPPLSFAPTMDESVEIRDHAVWVAGVLISTDTSDPDMDGDSPTGVVPGADLYSAGDNPTGAPTDEDVEVALTMDHLATLPGIDLRAINMSAALPVDAGQSLDGNQLLTQYIDWSALTHDILYVLAGNEVGDTNAVPTDNYNGMTIGASSRVGDVYRQVWTDNRYNQDAMGARTSIDLIAPGADVKSTDLGDTTEVVHGTSFSAPHVTGTVALLQEYAEERIGSGAQGWGANARRHQVMKAVLMNSADKIQGPLGMTRTVLKRNGDNWLATDAHTNPAIPLDEEIGAGHLNASRAVDQFGTGERDPGSVPILGWDYGLMSTVEPNVYSLNQSLDVGDYISVTLTWDRDIILDDVTAPFGEYSDGDFFINPFVENLDLYLMPVGETDTENAAASSVSTVQNTEHIFFEIEESGDYEVWVQWFDNGGSLPFTEYGLAWWGTTGITLAGDFDGNGMIDAGDYAVWQNDYGSTTNLAADGNGDGVVNSLDYVVWRDALTVSAAVAVPEPSALLLCAVGVCGRRIRRMKR